MWEGDESPMSSKWSHLLYADEEAKAEALQAHSDVHNVAIAKVMLAAKADRIGVMDSPHFSTILLRSLQRVAILTKLRVWSLIAHLQQWQLS